MFLRRYSKCILKPNLTQPKGFVKTSNLFKGISNKPLQKSSVVCESNFANKADNVISSQDDSVTNVHNKKSTEKVNVYLNVEENAQTGGKVESSEAMATTTPATTSPYSLVQRKDSAEVFLQADPFEEVPGPEILKKISSVWKYLPEIGCQATVSAMLSVFNVTQKVPLLAKMSKTNARPFDGLFKRYGPLIKLQGPLGSDIVLVSKPEHVAKIYEHEGKYPIRTTLDSVERCRSRSRKSCSGPFNINGVEWEELRRALHDPLAKGGEKYYEVMDEAADIFVRRIRAIRNRQSEVGNDFIMEVTKWSLECFCYVTLGKSFNFLNADLLSGSEQARLLKAVMDATTYMCKCESGFQFWRFMNTPSSEGLAQACEIIDSFVSKHIRLAQVNLTKNKDDMTSKDLSEPLPFIENLLLKECMAPDEVLTCIVDLLLIGVNSTSSALGFTLYHLAQNQRPQRTLFREIKEALPEKTSKLPYNHLGSLKYLGACVNENLRLNMPIPTLTRVLPSDIVLSNFRIPKGTYMVMDVQAACLKEQNFERCDKYIPERWYDPSNIQPFSFIPFGHGSRSCIGKHLAETQLKSCLAKIIRNYQVEYNYGEIQGTKTVISFPDRPLKLSFTERDE